MPKPRTIIISTHTHVESAASAKPIEVFTLNEIGDSEENGFGCDDVVLLQSTSTKESYHGQAYKGEGKALSVSADQTRRVKVLCGFDEIRGAMTPNIDDDITDALIKLAYAEWNLRGTEEMSSHPKQPIKDDCRRCTEMLKELNNVLSER